VSIKNFSSASSFGGLCNVEKGRKELRSKAKEEE
jgi:hypothetical protein